MGFKHEKDPVPFYPPTLAGLGVDRDRFSSPGDSPLSITMTEPRLDDLPPIDYGIAGDALCF